MIIFFFKKDVCKQVFYHLKSYHKIKVTGIILFWLSLNSAYVFLRPKNEFFNNKIMCKNNRTCNS